MRRENRSRLDSDERGYNHEWKKFRKIWLKRFPHCVYCKAKGRIRKATDVDHIESLRSNTRLKFHPGNLRSLCHSCHSRRTAIDERWAIKEELRIGPDGYPLDPGHPARKADKHE